MYVRLNGRVSPKLSGGGASRSPGVKSTSIFEEVPVIKP